VIFFINLSPLPPSLGKGRGVKVREGRSPSQKPLPSPLTKGRGIKGEGLVNNLDISDI